MESTTNDFMKNRINKKKLPKYRRRALEQWKDENNVVTCMDNARINWLAWVPPIGDRDFISDPSERRACIALAEMTGLPMPQMP